MPIYWLIRPDVPPDIDVLGLRGRCDRAMCGASILSTYSCPWSTNVLLSTVHSIPHVMLTSVYHMQSSMVIQSVAKFPNKAHRLQNWSLEHTQRTIQYNTALTVSCTLCTRVCIERAYLNDHDPLVYTRLAARLCAQ